MVQIPLSALVLETNHMIFQLCFVQLAVSCLLAPIDGPSGEVFLLSIAQIRVGNMLSWTLQTQKGRTYRTWKRLKGWNTHLNKINMHLRWSKLTVLYKQSLQFIFQTAVEFDDTVWLVNKEERMKKFVYDVACDLDWIHNEMVDLKSNQSGDPVGIYTDVISSFWTDSTTHISHFRVFFILTRFVN